MHRCSIHSNSNEDNKLKCTCCHLAFTLYMTIFIYLVPSFSSFLSLFSSVAMSIYLFYLLFIYYTSHTEFNVLFANLNEY